MSVAYDPVRVLIDDADPIRRSRAHLALGRLALARRDPGAAAEHLREAADLDPTDDASRELLEQLDARRRPRGWWPFKR